MWNPLINPGTHDMMRVVIYFIMLQAGGTVLLKKGRYDLEYPSASVVWGGVYVYLKWIWIIHKYSNLLSLFSLSFQFIKTEIPNLN